MIRVSLTQRLTLVFALILVVSCALIVWIQHKSVTRYSDTLLQNLSQDLASTIVQNNVLINSDGTANVATNRLFKQVAMYNPGIDIYLIDPQGNIIADADTAPVENLQHHKISLPPVQQSLHNAVQPVYGEDPRLSEGYKVFSAAPITDGSTIRGYLYIILQGENYAKLTQSMLTSSVGRSMLYALLLLLLCGSVIGGFAFYWVTRPVRYLVKLASPQDLLDPENCAAIGRLAVRRSRQKDDIARLKAAFVNLARRICQQWDNLVLQDKQHREFIANISQDLRIPLVSMQGYLETLTIKINELSEDSRRRYLKTALNHSAKVNILAQQLFELARFDHGAIALQYEYFSMPDLAQDVMQKFEQILKKNKLELWIKIEPNLPLVNADMAMLERIFTNLIDNATHYTPPGGDIMLRIWLQNDKLMMEIKDSGPGIAPERRQTLFERSTLINPERHDNGGLGLMIVRRILQLHHGDIQLIEAPGACFRFFIPVSP